MVMLSEVIKGQQRLTPDQMPFKKSNLTDPHIISLVDDVSKRTNIPSSEIILMVENELRKLKQIRTFSPKLYDAVHDNFAEDIMFTIVQKLMKKKKLDISDVNFDPKIFYRLVRLIQSENEGIFFPIKPRGEFKPLYKITPILVPNSLPAYRKFHRIKKSPDGGQLMIPIIDTAAATDKGEFVFNKDFMRNLIYFAEVTGLKAKDPKYESNGGPIPDSYAYIEFLIMHELLHYRFGDHINTKKYRRFSPQTHNWAMDFRINYILVKNGYEQLPIGLYSKELNFDVDETRTYERLLRVVQQERDKLPKPAREWLDKQVRTDEHEKDKEEEPVKPPKPLSVGQIVIRGNPGAPDNIGIYKVSALNSDGTAVLEPIPPDMEKKVRELIDTVKRGDFN